MGMSFLHTLSFRVLMGALVLLLLLFGFYSYFAIQFYTDQMTNSRLETANRMSDVIKKSTRYSMLLNRKEDVYQIITTLAREPGVEGVRIYNKRGEIIFSSEKNEEGTSVNLHAEACYACHDQAKPLESLPTGNRMRMYASQKGYRILGLIDPIRNETACSSADCHAHPEEKTVLGVLDVRMSMESIDKSILQARQTMMLDAVLTSGVVAFVILLFLSKTVLKPVKTLMNGVRQISSGNLDYQIMIEAQDELAKLAAAFNEMTKQLRSEKEQNRQWSQTLQERVAEKSEQLKSIHAQIVQIEKMASLGKLSATVAHELNNPLEAILTYAKLIARRLKKEPELSVLYSQTIEDAEVIAREADRCGTIVKNLLLFSRKQAGEFNLVPLREVIDNAVQIVHHHLSISNVQLQTSMFDDNLEIMCDPNQVEQALVALLVNAVEAMPDGGTIRINVTKGSGEDDVSISVSDTGVGIPESDLPNIFEPFFTTKENGKGVGLGLSVVYGIIERHGGRISVASKPGAGTTITIVFPRLSNRHNAAGKSAVLDTRENV